MSDASWWRPDTILLKQGQHKSTRSETKVSPTFAVLALRPWYERSWLSAATGMPLAAN